MTYTLHYIEHSYDDRGNNAEYDFDIDITSRDVIDYIAHDYETKDDRFLSGFEAALYRLLDHFDFLDIVVEELLKDKDFVEYLHDSHYDEFKDYLLDN